MAPALLPRISSRPNRATTASTTRRGASASVRSSTSVMTSAPFAPSASAVSWSASAPRATIATRQPSLASPAATARPIPLDPPVTSATRPEIPSSTIALLAGRSARPGHVRRRLLPGEPAEHGPGHEPRPAGVVLVEETPHQFAGRVEAGNRPVLGVQHLRARRDAEAAEREGDPACDGEADERRRVEPLRPVRLGRRDAVGPLPVEDSGIELPGTDAGVVGGHGPHEARRIDLELPRQLVDRAPLGLRHLADPVLLPEDRHHPLVEDLEREALRLTQDLAPVLRVGVVPE